MKIVSNESFLKSMQDLISNQNEDTTKKFEQEIKNTKFLSPVVILNKKDGDELSNKDIEFVNILDKDENNFFLAFTDWEKFNKFKKDNRFDAIEADIKDFEHMVTVTDTTAKGFVINIGDEAIFIPKETFA